MKKVKEFNGVDIPVLYARQNQTGHGFLM